MNMTQPGKNRVSIVGVLVPDQWAEDGEITGFALCTDDEQKYVLQPCNKENNLTLMLHQGVRVNGTVTEDAGGKTLLISELRPLSSREIAERGKGFVTIKQAG